MGQPIRFEGELQINKRNGRGRLIVDFDLVRMIEALQGKMDIDPPPFEDLWASNTAKALKERREWYKAHWGLSGRAAGILASHNIHPDDAIHLTTDKLKAMEGCGISMQREINSAIGRVRSW